MARPATQIRSADTLASPAPRPGAAWRAQVSDAAAAGRADDLAELLLIGDAMFVDGLGDSLLMMAIASGSAAAVEALIPEGDLDCVDGKGRAAIHLATMSTIGADFREGCVRALIAGGCDVDQPLQAGRFRSSTALHLAMRAGTGSRCAELLLAVADPDSRNIRGETPLMLAVDEGLDALMPAILAKADASLKDASGCTALMRAASSGRAEMAKLLRPFSNPDAQTPDGWTALMFAASIDSLEVVEALAAHSDPGLRNRDGLTACDISKRSESLIGSSKTAAILEARLLSNVERSVLDSEAAHGASRSRTRSL